MGRPRDGLGDIAAVADTPIEAEAPGVLSRSAIFRPLATGIKAIDAAVPVGLGQRELIIGDRQTGKTSIAIDTMLNQRSEEHTSELQSRPHLVCRLLLEKKNKIRKGGH